MSLYKHARRRFLGLTVATLSVAVVGNVACVIPPRLSVQAQRYRIEVQMDPTTHQLYGHTVLDLVRTGEDAPPPGHPVAVELLLHPDLEITSVATVGADGRYRGTSKMEPGDKDDDFTPQKHVVVLKEPADALTLFIDYEGELFQDVAAGEKPGEIHNFAMRAHIGTEGVFLGEGYWYPQPEADEEAAPLLGDYVVIADPIPGLELVAGAESDPVLAEQTGRLAWRSPYPLDGMVLVGGPHEIHRATHGDIEISVHLRPDQAHHAEGLINTVRRNLDRYQPLVGPYPAREYRVVDNFFSSGFAYPTFTLLSSAVINMGRRAQMRHGMFDHEMLHCWWGNGIHVDPRDGNWCEAITSYATNYYGYVLDENEKDARRKRRNYMHFLGRIKPEDDKPLDTFDRNDGCGRGIGYQKGAMVFHMLARTIGQENVWAAMRRLTDGFVGRYADWDDIRRVFEEASGVSLETFFKQWVRGAGAPVLSIDSARYDTAGQTLTITLSQGETAFELEVPVRVEHAGGHVDVLVPLGAPTQEVSVPIEVVPINVELDPDYHVFRKMPLQDIIPTTGATRYGSAFATVLPTGEVPEKFTTLQSIFESSFEEEGDERITRTVGDIEEGALASRCALILGEAVHDPYVAGYLSAIEFPVRFTEEGIEFDGVTYGEDGHAVLCTVAHPGVPGGGVTVLYGNSEAAIPPANFIPMYDRSLVIFKNGMPILRHDFEPRHVVPVER